MSNPRAFISFDFDNDSDKRILFVGQMKNSRTPFNIEDWSSKTVLPEKKWQDLIEAKVNKCNMLIVLVSKKTASATGVIKEIAFALEQNVPIFGVYVSGANSSTTLPKGLLRNRIFEWDWEKIATWVDICMTEGKNKTKR
jgi:hypothetical protein